jgi:MFS family permease
LQKIFRKIDLNNNITVVLFEAAFIGILITCDPYLPVFLTRLGASTFQVSLITSMPAVAGLFLTVPISRYLMGSSSIINWYRFPRLASAVAYFLAALIPFFIHTNKIAVIFILVIFGIAALPAVILMITFNVVMNDVAGPYRRYQLMARRLSIAMLTSAVSVALAGWFLEQITFPLNYQLLFIFFAVIGGGMIFFFASRIQLPANPAPHKSSLSIKETFRGYSRILKGNKNFSSFVWIRFVFILGLMTANPLIPIYYVREAHASDAWIGIITTIQLGIMVFGYTFWMRKARGNMPNHTILLWTTLALSLYPALLASTKLLGLIAVLAGMAYFFQAGLDLVFFDEMMRSVPPEESIPYVSLAQTIQYLGTIGGPLLGSFMADQIGLIGALWIGAGIRAVAFLLFFIRPKLSQPIETEPTDEQQFPDENETIAEQS